MALPDYQTVMLPLLKSLGDKKEYHIREVIEKLAADFQLSEDDRKVLPTRRTQRKAAKTNKIISAVNL